MDASPAEQGVCSRTRDDSEPQSALVVLRVSGGVDNIEIEERWVYGGERKKSGGKNEEERGEGTRGDVVCGR